MIPAAEAHKLFGSLGFPVDLTELMAEEQGMTVDLAGFEDLMEKDREIGAKAELLRKGGAAKDMSLVAEQTSWLQDNAVKTTDASDKYVWNEDPIVTVTAIFYRAWR